MNGVCGAVVQRQTATMGNMLRIFACAAVCVVMAEAIGSVKVPLGWGLSVTLLPLLWALMIGAAWGVLSPRMPRALSVSSDLQHLAALILQPALLIFIAKLGLLVGGSLPLIISGGWALLFQEFGHFLGTAVFGLPVALLLGIKREAIGATFSVGREPSLAIISERYGMNSPEGHGVLAEYITGTVFGAVFIAIFASLLASLNIFDPLAMAMGAGMGSGSLMAAVVGAISAQEPPEVAKQIAAFAAASNLITTTVGTYFTLFISLPFTIWAYNFLEPLIGRTRKNTQIKAEVRPLVDAESVTESRFSLSSVGTLIVWVSVLCLSLVGGYLMFDSKPDQNTFWGLVLILLPVVIGFIVYKVTFSKLPAVLWVSLVAMLMTSPICPYAAQVAQLTEKINFLTIATPVITFAGLSIARDLPIFRRLGWRIVVVSLMANAGTFLGATLIAQLFH